VPVDVRIISATHRDLSGLVAEGSFRQDLFYRLNVIPIHVPPLRTGWKTFPVGQTYLGRLRKPAGKDYSLHPEAWTCSWPMPGRQRRELINVLEYAAVTSRTGIISPANLPPSLQRRPVSMRLPVCLLQRDAEDEASMVRTALARSGGNKAAAARLLDQPGRVVEKMKRLGLDGRNEAGRHRARQRRLSISPGCSLSERIWATSSSGPLNFLSSRIRAMKSTLMSGHRIRSKSKQWTSTDSLPSLKVGLKPILATPS
jgi:transcriptional regulator with AAA-type ATPase domain